MGTPSAMWVSQKALEKQKILLLITLLSSRAGEVMTCLPGVGRQDVSNTDGSRAEGSGHFIAWGRNVKMPRGTLNSFFLGICYYPLSTF